MTTLRPIIARTRGHCHGPINRLISPDDLGDRLKPFIFLDFFDAAIEPDFGSGMHPPSGIAALTWQPGFDVRYSDTTGQNGVLKAGAGMDKCGRRRLASRQSFELWPGHRLSALGRNAGEDRGRPFVWPVYSARCGGDNRHSRRHPAGIAGQGWSRCQPDPVASGHDVYRRHLVAGAKLDLRPACGTQRCLRLCLFRVGESARRGGWQDPDGVGRSKEHHHRDRRSACAGPHRHRGAAPPYAGHGPKFGAHQRGLAGCSTTSHPADRGSPATVALDGNRGALVLIGQSPALPRQSATPNSFSAFCTNSRNSFVLTGCTFVAVTA